MLRNRFDAVAMGLVFAAGALLGWFVHESESAPPTAEHADSKASRSEASGESSLIECDHCASGGSVSSETPIEDLDAAADTPPERSTTVSKRAESPIPAPPGDPDQLFAGGDLSSLRDADIRDTDDRSKLHGAYRLSCQFGTGVNAHVGDGMIQTGEASWQGGAITYDVIDSVSGRATMSGSAGATGTSTGSVEIRMAGTNAGLSFSGIVPRGDLISTTVFPQRDAQGEFLAVMSTHAVGTGHMASQFYGSCNVQ